MGGADFLSGDGNRVSKGDLVIIPIRLLNRSTEVWGEDANEFRYAQVSPFIMLYVLTGRNIAGRSDGMMFPMR